MNFRTLKISESPSGAGQQNQIPPPIQYVPIQYVPINFQPQSSLPIYHQYQQSPPIWVYQTQPGPTFYPYADSQVYPSFKSIGNSEKVQEVAEEIADVAAKSEENISEEIVTVQDDEEELITVTDGTRV